MLFLRTFYIMFIKHSWILIVALPSAHRSMHAMYIIMYVLSIVSQLLKFALIVDSDNSWVAQQVAS